MTTVADGLFQYGGMPVTPGIPVPFTGQFWWVDPANGADGNDGRSPKRAFATLYQAHNKALAGRNDCIILIGDGGTAATARLSLANAQSINPAATSGTLNWTKNAVHLIGIAAPTGVSQRARLAPPTGTYTQATFGSGNFVTVSASGCYFGNFSLFHGFSTGGTNQICWTDTGSRNFYANVHFGGMGDAASAQDTGSRSLKIGSGGSGEHTFHRCTIGLDTVTRTVANASLEFAGATPRSRFVECVFPFQGSAAGVLGILGTGNGCVDRWNIFERCMFINNTKSTSTTITDLGSFTTASPGGLVLFKDCALVGITGFGDANFVANAFIEGGTPTAATTGLAVAPAA